MMRAFALVACLLSPSCASAGGPVALAPPKGPTAALTRRIVYLGPGAVACPISPRLAYTAGHVMVLGGGEYMTWEGQGEKGRARLVARPDGDLALIETEAEVPFPAHSNLATTAPEVGDEVVIATRTEFMLDRQEISLYQGRVFGIDREGRLLVDTNSCPGSSGGCVWNAKGDVVAIHTGVKVWPSHPWVRAMNTNAPVWRR